ncbi:hypothetical protein KUTeg_010935 [Tegillarca granosa]|uniref:Chitin-binding type-4 domain-containing protein n=1 Tax=Tegillarca granosa TaxID=220873 RepID=A0ABQ9F7M0_TEGGR|nr:hypothetical protein KUTeg_010935 [Tegillarca granosa]
MFLLCFTVIIACFTEFSLQHGFLAVPPQRSSLWREEFDSPVNYNDNELYCGGRGTIQRLGGLCGVCGDPYEGPRENEAGGKFANGIIARRYEFGALFFKSTVALTAYHKGYFEFRLCPHNNPNAPVKQECLNKYLLPVANHEDLNSADVLYRPPGPGIYNLTVFLPTGIRCSQCVIQWRYRTGNSWGVDPNGTACTGCGIQEEFRNCADVSIGDDENTDVDVADIDPRFINKDERKNLFGEGVKVSVERKNPTLNNKLNQMEQGHDSHIPRSNIPKEKTSKSILMNLNKIVNKGDRIITDKTTKIKKKNNAQSTETKASPQSSDVKASTKEIKNDKMHSGNSIDRSDVIGGVWSESLEKYYSPEKEKLKLKTLIYGLTKKYKEVIKIQKLKRASYFLSKQFIRKIDSTPNLRKLAMQLRYLIARFHNRHLYTRLVPSSYKRNSSAVYKNLYNYIAKNSLEAQTVQRSWKFSPNFKFRSSRYFAT